MLQRLGCGLGATDRLEIAVVEIAQEDEQLGFRFAVRSGRRPAEALLVDPRVESVVQPPEQVRVEAREPRPR